MSTLIQENEEFLETQDHDTQTFKFLLKISSYTMRSLFSNSQFSILLQKLKLHTTPNPWENFPSHFLDTKDHMDQPIPLLLHGWT